MRKEVHQYKFNVPIDLMEKLREISARESRSVSAQMNLMLRKQVETYEANT